MRQHVPDSSLGRPQMTRSTSHDLSGMLHSLSFPRVLLFLDRRNFFTNVEQDHFIGQVT